MRISPSQADIPPPPSPDFIPFHHHIPPSPPPTAQSGQTSKKDRKKKANGQVPPPLPPKDTREPEITLDTDLDKMEGIIDLTILPPQTMSTDTSSPSSMFGSSDHSTGLTSDVSSSLGTMPYSAPGYTQQPTFNNPFHPSSSSKRKMGPSDVDKGKISPKTRPPIHQKLALQENVPPADDSPAWTAPESWAVEKEGEDPAGGAAAYSSSDDSVTLKAPHAARKKRRRTTIARELRAKGSGSHLFKIRIYRANNTYHVVSIDLGVTVAELTPVLNKKLLLDPEAEVHRLYLKERGRGEYFVVCCVVDS